MKKPGGRFFFVAGLVGTLAVGWLAFPLALYERQEQPLGFSHRAHGADGAGLTCEGCHPILPDGRFAGIPGIETCAGCHEQPIGASADEKRLVEQYVSKHREIPWLAYAREPDNVRFSHAVHVRLGGLACEQCHGPHGTANTLRPFDRNRITGYSRDIWGPSLSRLGLASWQGKKMNDCSRCHADLGIAESCLGCHK